MTNGVQQPPAVPAKKGLSPWAWVGIGCGALLVIVLVVLVAGGLFVAHKVKEAGFDPEMWQKNPAMAASKLVTALNPDIEVVTVDEDEGTIPVRNKKTGEEITVDLDDVKNGNISFRSEKTGKEVKISAEQKGEGGNVTITDEKGKSVMSAGSGVASDLPSWVPVYPGTSPKVGFTMKEAGKQMGSATAKTDDAVDAVVQFYTKAMDSGGFSVSQTISSTGDSKTAYLTGTKDELFLQVIATNKKGATTISVNYKEEEK